MWKAVMHGAGPARHYVPLGLVISSTCLAFLPPLSWCWLTVSSGEDMNSLYLAASNWLHDGCGLTHVWSPNVHRQQASM